MKEIFEAVSQVGFPIVISILLLVLIERRMESLQKEIHELSKSITEFVTIIRERTK